MLVRLLQVVRPAPSMLEISGLLPAELMCVWLLRATVLNRSCPTSESHEPSLGVSSLLTSHHGLLDIRYGTRINRESWSVQMA